MDSFNQATGFRYNLNSNNSDDANDDSDCSGMLEIFVHHARNIHNIFIYDNQDVYAKFSLTYNPDEILSTSIINGGGKNPEFNENLRIKITQFDALLKCEIWMHSRARTFMEDQLLGFALVPIPKIVGKGKVTENYSLSSTDLTHSPAGTVRLAVSLNTLNPSKSISESLAISSISSKVVLLDRKISEEILDPIEYSRIEFPDLCAVRENQQMVSQYFDLPDSSSTPLAPFLHLGAFYEPVDDYEMAANSSQDLRIRSISTNGSLRNSSLFISTTTTLSDDRNSAQSIEKNGSLVETSISTEADCQSSDTATSKKGRGAINEKEPNSNFSSKKEETNYGGNAGSVSSFTQIFSAPLPSMNLEADPSAMQKQIVDMYMRSMKQFTESLAKMKLPMDLDEPEHESRSVLLQSQRKNPKRMRKMKELGFFTAAEHSSDGQLSFL